MRLFIFTILLFFVQFTALAQDSTCLKIFYSCDSAFAEGDRELAMEFGQQLIECDSLFPDFLYHYAVLHAFDENWDESTRYFEKFFLCYRDSDSLDILNTYYLSPEGVTSTLKTCNQGIKYSKSAKSKSLFYFNRALVEERMGASYLAYADYLEAYKLDPSYVKGIWNLALIHTDIGKAQDGLNYFYLIIEKDTLREYKRNVLHNLGFFHLILENYDSAYYYMDRVFSSAAEDSITQIPYAQNNFAHYLLKTGQPDSALYRVNISIQSDSTNPAAYYNKGLIMLELGDTIEACHAFKDAEDKGFIRYGYAKNLQQLIDEHCRGKGIFVRF